MDYISHFTPPHLSKILDLPLILKVFLQNKVFLYDPEMNYRPRFRDSEWDQSFIKPLIFTRFKPNRTLGHAQRFPWIRAAQWAGSELQQEVLSFVSSTILVDHWLQSKGQVTLSCKKYTLNRAIKTGTYFL